MINQIILGSGSPRRKELLQYVLTEFEVQAFDIEEETPKSLPVAETASYLAELKAKESGMILRPNQMLVTADTIVLKENRLFGKPNNHDEAREFLFALSNSKHEVITAVCLHSEEQYALFEESTEVYFDSLTESEIEYYINKYQPFDKAGAYGIQEWIGAVGINKIVGDYFNVVGLPVCALRQQLKVMNIAPELLVGC